MFPINEVVERILDADRWVGPPASLSRSTWDEEACHQQQSKHWHKPERCCIEPRKGHVGSTDHRGNQQIVETIQNREKKEEQHHCSVHCVKTVVDAGVDQISWWSDQFTPHHHRQEPANKQEKQRGGDVLNANHLGIGVEAEKALPVVWGTGHGVWRLEDAWIEIGGCHESQASWGIEASPGSFTIGGAAGGTVAHPLFPLASRLA